MTTWINSQFPRPDFHRQVQRHYGLQDTGFPPGFPRDTGFPAQPKDRVVGWRTGPEGEAIGLLDVVRNARPTILIGASGQPGTFTEVIALAVAAAAHRDGLAALCRPEDIERLVDSKMCQMRYLTVTLKRSGV